MVSAFLMVGKGLMQTHLYHGELSQISGTVVSRVSAHLCVSAHPPDPTIRVYKCYMYKWLLHVSAHPQFLAPCIRRANWRSLGRIR